MRAPLTSSLVFAAVLFAALAVRAFARARAGPQGRSGDRRALAALQALRRLPPGFVAAMARREIGPVIERAGLAESITARDVAAARAACVLGALLLAPRLAAMLPPRSLVLVLPLFAWAAAEFPLFLLARRAARRADALRATLPDALDLLRACLAAGLPLRRSFSLVARHCADPAASEFARVAAETAFGVPQAAALDSMAIRNPLPEVRALVSAIRQAERGGSPLAPVIAAQARDARLALNRAIVERGARAGPKIQLVVSATIVPGALIAFAAIVIAAFVRGDLKLL